MEKLIKIQATLKCAKTRKNSFGGYKYRSCEDILEALKPRLEMAGVMLTLSDKAILMGEQVAIEATAVAIDAEDGEVITTATGYAGVEKTGGMSLSQSYGSASSYARKYALNGLFLIDDSVDDDATNQHGKSKVSKPKAPAAKSIREATLMVMNALEASEETNWEVCKPFKSEKLKHLTFKEAIDQNKLTKETLKQLGGVSEANNKQKAAAMVAKAIEYVN